MLLPPRPEPPGTATIGRAPALVLAAVLAAGCMEAYRERLSEPLSEVPARPSVLRIEPDACPTAAHATPDQVENDPPSTRLRKVTDSRRVPARVGAMHDFNKLDPIPLFQDPNMPLRIALSERVSRALGSSVAPDLLVADITLREAWVESHAASWFALRGTVTASFAFSVEALNRAGSAPAPQFRGEATDAYLYFTVAQHQALLQAAFCESVASFEVWLAGSADPGS